MTGNYPGPATIRFSVCEESTYNTKTSGRSHNRRRVALAFTIVAGVMMTPDVFSPQGHVLAKQESAQGEEIKITDKPVVPTELPPIQNFDNMNNGNQYCEIVVVSPGTIGTGIGNKVMSSKIMGGRAGTAHINATNSSYSLSIDNPVGFSTNPAGGNASVVMSASFMGNGDTNFSETPGNYNIRIKKGLTIVQTHMTAERTDGYPFPAGYYAAEITLRCE